MILPRTTTNKVWRREEFGCWTERGRREYTAETKNKVTSYFIFCVFLLKVNNGGDLVGWMDLPTRCKGEFSSEKEVPREWMKFRNKAVNGDRECNSPKKNDPIKVVMCCIFEHQRNIILIEGTRVQVGVYGEVKTKGNVVSRNYTQISKKRVKVWVKRNLGDICPQEGVTSDLGGNSSSDR